MTNPYERLINALPKPETLEEQYIYALICSTANVTPKYPVTTTEPFRRMDQYWQLFYKVTEMKLKALEVPGSATVSTNSIQNNAVTIDKIASSVENRLLGENRVTEAMLASAVAQKLLSSGRITETMLASAVAEKLLANDRIVTDMVLDKAITKAKLSQEVQDILAKVK